ncbi:unnamed protein product [Chrysodeixis includens]|uniref:Uncharacterized protein n=1 Tax=Chrysodeixis includens TaxID=689277 RepID=A0A9P0FQT6_CHRIL|nr:unnamed protein product [Chrysodeixis includens]
MKVNIVSFFNFIYFLNTIYCYDSESSESNRIEVTPFYDTIIYSDIADIINDFENNGVSPLDVIANSESQSDENVDELLSEYQKYLEKAHKQRKNYIEKSKSKNKVPLLPRHDQFSKTKTSVDNSKHDEYYYANGFYNAGTFKFPPASYGNPLDVFIPVNSKGKYVNKPEATTILPKGVRDELFPIEKIMFNDKKLLDLTPVLHKSPLESIKSSCYCKNGHIPCDCSCKQCLVHFDPMSRDHNEQMKLRSPDDQKKHALLYDGFFKKPEHLMDDNIKDMLPDNTLNIRIKIDLQLPKPQEILGKLYKIHNHEKVYEPDDVISKELTTAINLPFPYFNFPTPDLFGYKKAAKLSKDDTTPLHKITIHKKKKSRANNNNKKHRKKLITFHNIKLEQQPLFPSPSRFSDNNISETYRNDNSSNIANETILAAQASNALQIEINSMINKTDDMLNETQTDESIYLMVNITNNAFNSTDDTHKIENSIETDFPKNTSNITTKVPSTREKRDVSKVIANNVTNNKNYEKNTPSKKDNSAKVSLNLNKIKPTLPPAKNDITKEKGFTKKADKSLLSDSELLYWPNVTRNKGDVKSKNITTIILENEHKKTKLNMTKETIRLNHTRALEQAIFGEVDWDDVDTVAPAFMSFVGKYIRGVLTFCSQKVCHSMKCANKTCLHRVCLPSDRLNNKGHCAGTNSTDSVASMESIMDLPSNIAFEIVDILQNKMLGKIFGKATFCINSKCITLVTSKKNFVKSRCSIKELNAAGHCPNAKNSKVM